MDEHWTIRPREKIAETKESDAFEAMKFRLQLPVSGFFQHLQPISHRRESRLQDHMASSRKLLPAMVAFRD
jgi:hypothetical protein